MTSSRTLDREVDSAKETLSQAADVASERLNKATQSVQDAAVRYAEDGKQVAANQMSDIAHAARAASDALAERDQPFVARIAADAAEGIDTIAEAVADRSVNEIMDGAQDFARKNPAVFFAAAVLAGVVIGRFAKASSERAHSDDQGAPDAPVVAPSGSKRAVAASRTINS
ncbi:MAG: hypothetical protein ROR55_24785 [Devosia sp.]